MKGNKMKILDGLGIEFISFREAWERYFLPDLMKLDKKLKDFVERVYANTSPYPLNGDVPRPVEIETDPFDYELLGGKFKW